MLHPKSRIHLIPVVVVALVLVLVLAVAPALAQLRMHVIPFDSVTLTAQQVLLGETQGKPVTLAGELRLPRGGTDKVPVVILVHGINGLTPTQDEWARALNSWGIGTFITDHLSGRDITPMSPGDLQLAGGARMVDVYRALSVLSKHPRIDPERIAVMGFSMGGLATLISSQERFRTRYGPTDVQFSAYIALYASYPARLRDDVKVAARPIRLYHGTGDDWTTAAQCRALVEDLKKAGADVTMTEYSGATHSYDDPSFKVRLNFAGAFSVRNCSLAEGEGGQIMNSQTGKPFTPTDTCVERGTSLFYDEAATASTREAVKAVLASAFASKKAAAAPAAAETKEWVDINDPNELRAIYSNKTFKGTAGGMAYVSHYRSDGKGIMIINQQRNPRNWEVKGNDQVCFTDAMGGGCFKLQRNKQNRNEFIGTHVTGGWSAQFTVEDGIPEF
jgi:dienelactone hydrolase